MNDPADTRPFAVVRSRLPYTDRRSLSQAWRSALHVSSEDGMAGETPRRAYASSAAVVVRSNAIAPPPSSGARVAAGARVVSRAAGARVAASPIASDASVRKNDVRSVARAAAAFERARSYPPFQTSLTVGVEGARVQLLLRREGGTLHVVALCTPASVELVRRALAHADAHLRRSGETVRASVRIAEAAV